MAENIDISAPQGRSTSQDTVILTPQGAATPQENVSRSPGAENTPEGADRSLFRSLRRSPLRNQTVVGEVEASRPDTLNSEFMYYSSVLKVLTGALANQCDKSKILLWCKKLFRPEYHTEQFREKRNKYLTFLTLSLLNDEAFGIFATPPPSGALVAVEQLEKTPIAAAEWELDPTWRDTVANLGDDFEPLDCSVHDSGVECNLDHSLDAIMDQEFMFMLYLIRPYASLLRCPYERTKVAMWMQTLCSITGSSCSSMRGIRNDYMMALLGYVQNLRLVGPFADYPPVNKLPPLPQAAAHSGDRKPITDPSCNEASDFLMGQPVPDEGAFCYIALTGDLISSSIR